MGTEDCECRWEWYGKEGRAAEESPDAKYIMATVLLDPLTKTGPPKRDMCKRKKKEIPPRERLVLVPICLPYHQAVGHTPEQLKIYLLN